MRTRRIDRNRQHARQLVGMSGEDEVTRRPGGHGRCFHKQNSLLRGFKPPLPAIEGAPARQHGRARGRLVRNERRRASLG